MCHSTTVSVNYNDNATTCSTASCHGTGGTVKGALTTASLNKTTHVNRSRDVSFAAVSVKSKAQLRPESFADYTAAGGYWTRSSYKTGLTSTDTAKLVLNNTMYSNGNCSNIACHNGKTVNWTADLGKAAQCVICHTRL